MAFDLSSIGVPLDERYPQDLALEAIDGLQAALPAWVARNASPEVVLIEAVALAVADIVNAANNTIASIEQDILDRQYQVPRLAGSPATGAVTVIFDSTVTQTIPAGTSFLLTDYGVEVATTAEVTVTADTSVVLDVSTAEATTLVNGVGAGAGIDVLSVIPNILTVAITTAMAGGASEEGDPEYIARSRNKLQLVTNSLVVPSHYEGFVRLDGRALNALCIPAWDGTGAPGSGDAGHLTVVVYGRGGTLSAGVKTDLEELMAAITYVGATVHVIDATVVSVPVTMTVKAAPGYTVSEAQAAAVAAIDTFLDPESWPIGDDVIVGALEAAIIDTAAVDYIVSTTLPASDTTLDADEVPTPGTVTISAT